jgi:hypothetical protein
MSLLRDVRYSLRALRKTPAFTVGAVVTIALTVVPASPTLFGHKRQIDIRCSIPRLHSLIP